MGQNMGRHEAMLKLPRIVEYPMVDHDRDWFADQGLFQGGEGFDRIPSEDGGAAN